MTAVVPKAALDFKVTTCFWELLSLSPTGVIPSVDNIIDILTGCDLYGERIIVFQKKPYPVVPPPPDTGDYPEGQFSFEWFMKLGEYDQAKAIYDMNHDKPMASHNSFLKCFIDTASSLNIPVQDPCLISTCRIIKQMPASLVHLSVFPQVFELSSTC